MPPYPKRGGWRRNRRRRGGWGRREEEEGEADEEGRTSRGARRLLDASRSLLGCLLGSLLEAYWGVVGASWRSRGPLGASWVHRGASWGLFPIARRPIAVARRDRQDGSSSDDQSDDASSDSSSADRPVLKRYGLVQPERAPLGQGVPPRAPPLPPSYSSSSSSSSFPPLPPPPVSLANIGTCRVWHTVAHM